MENQQEQSGSHEQRESQILVDRIEQASEDAAKAEDTRKKVTQTATRAWTNETENRRGTASRTDMGLLLSGRKLDGKPATATPTAQHSSPRYSGMQDQRWRNPCCPRYPDFPHPEEKK